MRCTAFAVAFLISAFCQTAAWAQIDFGHVFRGLSALSSADGQADAQEASVTLTGEDPLDLSEPSELTDAGASELELLEPAAEQGNTAPPPPPAEPAPQEPASETTSLDSLHPSLPSGSISHPGTSYFPADTAAVYGDWNAPRAPACGSNCGAASLHYGHRHPQPMTIDQLFAPPPHVQGLWDTYPQEYYEAEEKRRAMQYRKPKPRWLGCNEDGIYIGPAPYPFHDRPCDSIAKKAKDAGSAAEKRIAR